ncbi:putative DNA polymerase kappa, putative,DNA polymerase IV, partial [Trypanosoma grayi]|uniref:putative DNA polymerase kappa, putative,DNA polymerase IV n=1 Tax=Trypanosoma grayi TaxID=71804 RepID=UPI0004F45D47
MSEKAVSDMSLEDATSCVPPASGNWASAETIVDVRNGTEGKDNGTVPPQHPSNVPLSSGFQLRFDSNKAGLEKADKARTEAIIEEASRGTSYYINERRKAESRKLHVLQLQQKVAEFAQYMGGEKNAARRRQWELKVSQVEKELEAGRQFGNYVHVDMDMFYAAVEMKKNPSLAEVPL